MKKFYSGILTLLILGVVFVPSANAETNTTTTTTSTASIDAMLAQIKVLMAKVVELQKQLGTIKGEVRAVLKDGLAEGMSSDDIRKVQELLATDSAIYPEGKVTGYYGRLTVEALKRFQTRHELEITGTMNEETKSLLEEYLHEGFGDRIPPGLLHAPGIMKKVELRFRDGCDNSGHGKNILCKKLKIKYEDDDKDENEDEDDDSNDDDEDEDEDEDDDSNDDGFDVEVEVEDDSTTVSFTVNNKDYNVEATSTDLDDVLDAVADKLDVDVDDLDEDLVDEIESELDDANDDADEDEAKDDADEAIEDAEDAIDDAQDAIDDATGSTTEAEALLDDAEDKLADAKTAFTAKKYADAEAFANKAEDLAEDAEDAV
jgi:peptidoglycan hydrolase-like protein with peptidoglycan-binding domain